MKIIYGVSGEGYGHATRSRPLIKFLQKKHNVRVFCGAKAHRYLKNHFSVNWSPSLRQIYVRNTVSDLLTFLYTVLISPLLIAYFIRMLFVIIFWKPKVIVSDFELFCNYAGLFLGVPVISVFNGSIITQGKIKIPKGRFWSYLKVFIAVKLVNPVASAYVIPSFFSVKTSKKAVLTYSSLRKEITRLKPEKKDHILVFQTSRSNTDLFPALKKINENFIIHGFNREEKDRNLVFRKFVEKQFYNDLANCKAVITNGGFSLISEALYLKKPVLALPIKGQFEQELNAYYLQKLGYGMVSEKITSKAVRQFLSKLSRFSQALKALRIDENEMQKKLAQVIGRVSKG